MHILLRKKLDFLKIKFQNRSISLNNFRTLYPKKIVKYNYFTTCFAWKLMLFSTFVNEVGVKRRCWCWPTWKLMLFSTFVNEVGEKRRWGWCWRCCSNAGERSGERLKVFLTFSIIDGYYCLNNSSHRLKYIIFTIFFLSIYFFTAFK